MPDMPLDPDERRRDALREFLRTRRARLTPGDVGMPDGGRRRTPGLRREEVAVLAGVGVSWYTWLEQGRDIKVSEDVLDAIGRALRLDGAEREHLYLLAGLNPPRREPAPALPVSPELHRLLDAWSPRPAYVQDRHWGFQAVNDAARVVFGYGDTDLNCLVSYFTNARFRTTNTLWARNAPGVVGRFRADMARYPDDPEFARIASDLAAVSPDFAELWDRHDVSTGAEATKAIRHPEVGELVFDATLLPLPDRPGLNLVLHNPRPGTGTAERLERLMSDGPRLVEAG
ncbi:helix-turn-helix transcriptional regulator [Actinomadura rupiterrae]|uniref:helix-turn-helix transcriptional regulator n=1 Tax=Actinomadura rupiterrae TaxID=559627 RepID=UPI0020A2F7CF|nr:helix-turn-helix transcriptional regulator [Actinomadura rupiterrae]MCP2341004.1 transcriptional regulator with XRE-family HTH domain [Actinomadura rupiterrae]